MCGLNIPIITSTATRGSNATRVTQQLPGLKCGALPASLANAR
jgi:hypothetical protein